MSVGLLAHTSIFCVGALSPSGVDHDDYLEMPAGDAWQRNIVATLAELGHPCDAVVAQRPMQLFPRGSTWIVRGMVERTQGYAVDYPAFLNLPLLRTVSVSIGTLSRFGKWAWANRKNPRVVLHFNLTQPFALPTWLACRFTRTLFVPFIMDIHVPGDTTPDTLLRRMNYRQHAFLIPRLDGFVAVTQAIPRDFCGGDGTSSCLQIDGGAEPAQVALAQQRFSKKPLTVDSTPFTIIYAGKLDDTNGIRTLIEAFRGLDSTRYMLLIAGEGPLRRVVERSSVEISSLTYLGRLPRTIVYEWYQRVDAAICYRPTKELATDYFFPSKVLEYLATGVPVIATATGHLVDEYGSYVTLIQDESVSGIREAVRTAATAQSQSITQAVAGAAYMEAEKTWLRQTTRLIGFVRHLQTKQA